MNFLGYIGQVTIFSLMPSTASCLVLGLGLGLHLVPGWIVVMHTHFIYFLFSFAERRGIGCQLHPVVLWLCLFLVL